MIIDENMVYMLLKLSCVFAVLFWMKKFPMIIGLVYER
jgi:hypothetical protein